MNNLKTLILATIILSLAACIGEAGKVKKKGPEDIESTRYDRALEGKLDVFEALKSDFDSTKNPFADQKVVLGHRLFFDTQLSKNHTISCNSCHNLATFGVDNLATSPGDAGEFGNRNSPTVLNASLHTSQFWDGRAKDVEEQAGMPILNPIEMAIPNESFLIDRLKADEQYVDLFSKSYPDEESPINYENLRIAIAAFERELITPSDFDLYLQGHDSVLSVKEKKGLLSFINVGCTTCHAGKGLGGSMIQKFGVHKDYWAATSSKDIDAGRYDVTGDSLDMYMFKVPSLRNIEMTGPYFHDGSVKDLSEAVKIMAEIQLDYTLSESELENILAFLGSLTAEIPEAYQSATSD